MPHDREDDRRGHKPPEKPAPHLRPHGPLLAMGNAEARRSQESPGRQVNANQGPVPASPALSEQDKAAERCRAKERDLQANGLKVVRDQHEPKLQQRREEFDQQHRREIQTLQSERQAIQDRRSGGELRQQWNRWTGREAQDDKRLEQLDQQQAQLDVQRDQYLQPVLDDLQKELAAQEEINRGYMERLEEEIQRDIYGEQTHDRDGRGDDEPERTR